MKFLHPALDHVFMRLALSAAGLSLAWLTGCASSPKPEVSAADAETQRIAAVERELEDHYIIGPALARAMNYHIDWQTNIEPFQGSGIDIMSAQGDAVFLLDGNNFLSRVARDNGRRLWRLAVEDLSVAIQAVALVPKTGNVVLTVGSNLQLLDGANGLLIRKQDLKQIASTEPIPFGSMIIYGSQNGQIVWHNYEIGATWKAYQIAPSMTVQPQLIDGRVYAVGAGGRLVVLDANRVTMVWDKTLLDEVVAPPVVGEGLVFLAGTDQQLWAFHANTGRRVWRYLAEAPLTSSPTLLDKKLYQQVPGVGLFCFDAVATNLPGGKLLWSAKGVPGNVLAGRNGRLLVWDEDSRKMSVVSAAQGSVVATVDLPNVDRMQTVDLAGSEIIAACTDGRVIRLSPN